MHIENENLLLLKWRKKYSYKVNKISTKIKQNRSYRKNMKIKNKYKMQLWPQDAANLWWMEFEFINKTWSHNTSFKAD